MKDTTYYQTLKSPVGELLLLSNGTELTGLYTHKYKRRPAPPPEWRQDPDPFRDVQEQLKAYFAGKLTEFDIPMVARGTPFQERVWKELCAIPYGETISYGELARRVRKPKAARAVGAANGRNPISIIIPCHRVIGSDRSLIGYGGGLDCKRTLLTLEAALPT